MKEQEFMKRMKELYLPPIDRFVLVDVPELRFLMIDGQGDPQDGSGQQIVKWLFTVVHPIRLEAKKRMGKRFVEPPLESLWWARDLRDLTEGKRDKLKWRMMIVLPEWADDTILEQAKGNAKQRLGELPESLRVESYHEGKSVQIMHVGHPSEQCATMTQMHEEFLPTQGLIPNGLHHEIYLNDSNRVDPRNLKTVLRQPVK